MAKREIKVGSADISRLRLALANMQVMLDIIGATMVSHSQHAFSEQRFGEYKWPRQYSQTKKPYIHAAGALSDLLKGGKIKDRRFKQGKALMDTGRLLASLDYRVLSGNSVEYGSNLEYAGIQNAGGVSTQNVTPAARKSLAKQIKKEKNEDRKDALHKLANRLKDGQMKTRVHKRPFVGITDEMERDIQENLIAGLEDIAGR